MKLPFLDRAEESARLRRLLASPEGSFGVLWGRRRCGKSRLLREVVAGEKHVYAVGDDRAAPLQLASLARDIDRLLPGFASVDYPGWEPLLERFWNEAPSGAALCLDELPALVAQAPELPSLLQKRLDEPSEKPVHLIVAGSSQRMMQGLVLDRAAPLFGRAREILKVAPLRAGWIVDALQPGSPIDAIEAYSVWGGTPRYWELAGDHPDLRTAIRALILSPLGVLHEEPTRLLLDDLRDTTQAASVLSLIGQGCHRLSEIAGRLHKPATSLSRPLALLHEMGLVEREIPFGASPRSGKRSLYVIADPFLRFWYRFVEPHRSLLEAGLTEEVEATVDKAFPHHAGGIWEELARASVPRLRIGGGGWGPARRWWGPGQDRQPMELDVVAESLDGRRLLIGEAKWTDADPAPLLAELRRKTERLPLVGDREVEVALWLRRSSADRSDVVVPGQVLEVLR